MRGEVGLEEENIPKPRSPSLGHGHSWNSHQSRRSAVHKAGGEGSLRWHRRSYHDKTRTPEEEKTYCERQRPGDMTCFTERRWG
ncbi:hypothetical protein NDU88_001205 [Pleurodeles waltl]|uniref:Uncharacterized protein n=1 Tax=Pleurodeles waltl TaxID=8319 RepID=A0AAV7PBV2_PLEWA|nr:hypothetical protein NDU88_001205 [Pleurodeles waltl]